MMQFSTVNAVVTQIEVFSVLCAVFYMLQTIKKRKKKKLLKEDRRKLADKLTWKYCFPKQRTFRCLHDHCEEDNVRWVGKEIAFVTSSIT